MAALEPKVDSINLSLASVEERVGSVETRLSAVETSLAAVEARLSHVEIDLGSVAVALSMGAEPSSYMVDTPSADEDSENNPYTVAEVTGAIQVAAVAEYMILKS